MTNANKEARANWQHPVNKHLYLSRELEERLKARSGAEGVKESEIVRKALEKYLKTASK